MFKRKAAYDGQKTILRANKGKTLKGEIEVLFFKNTIELNEPSSCLCVCEYVVLGTVQLTLVCYVETSIHWQFASWQDDTERRIP